MVDIMMMENGLAYVERGYPWSKERVTVVDFIYSFA